MSRTCLTCGGLIPTLGETLQYSGPICPGNHYTFMWPPFNYQPLTPQDTSINEKLDKIIKLLESK